MVRHASGRNGLGILTSFTMALLQVLRAQCPVGHEYEGHCYVIQTGKSAMTSWEDAGATCREMSGFLPVVERRGVQNFLVDLMSTSELTEIWLGGENHLRDWHWASDGGGPVASQGCYRDFGGAPDLQYYHTIDDMVPAHCIRLCKDAGMTYAAVMSQRECSCGDTYGRYGLADSTIGEWCSTTCPGDYDLYCGGWGLNSVFNVHGGAGDWAYKKPENPDQTCAVLESEYVSGETRKYADAFCYKQYPFICTIPLLKCNRLEAAYHTESGVCIYIGQNATWWQADDNCEAIGGALLAINDSDQLSVISSVLRRAGLLSRYWIGLTRDDWFWQATATRMTFAAWAAMSPSKRDHACVAMTSASGYKWVDRACDDVITTVCVIACRQHITPHTNSNVSESRQEYNSDQLYDCPIYNTTTDQQFLTTSWNISMTDAPESLNQTMTESDMAVSTSSSVSSTTITSRIPTTVQPAEEADSTMDILLNSSTTTVQTQANPDIPSSTSVTDTRAKQTVVSTTMVISRTSSISISTDIAPSPTESPLTTNTGVDISTVTSDDTHANTSTTYSNDNESPRTSPEDVTASNVSPFTTDMVIDNSTTVPPIIADTNSPSPLPTDNMVPDSTAQTDLEADTDLTTITWQADIVANDSLTTETDNNMPISTLSDHMNINNSTTLNTPVSTLKTPISKVTSDGNDNDFGVTSSTDIVQTTSPTSDQKNSTHEPSVTSYINVDTTPKDALPGNTTKSSDLDVITGRDLSIIAQSTEARTTVHGSLKTTPILIYPTISKSMPKGPGITPTTVLNLTTPLVNSETNVTLDNITDIDFAPTASNGNGDWSTTPKVLAQDAKTVSDSPEEVGFSSGSQNTTLEQDFNLTSPGAGNSSSSTEHLTYRQATNSLSDAEIGLTTSMPTTPNHTSTISKRAPMMTPTLLPERGKTSNLTTGRADTTPVKETSETASSTAPIWPLPAITQESPGVAPYTRRFADTSSTTAAPSISTLSETSNITAATTNPGEPTEDDRRWSLFEIIVISGLLLLALVITVSVLLVICRRRHVRACKQRSGDTEEEGTGATATSGLRDSENGSLKEGSGVVILTEKERKKKQKQDQKQAKEREKKKKAAEKKKRKERKKSVAGREDVDSDGVAEDVTFGNPGLHRKPRHAVKPASDRRRHRRSLPTAMTNNGFRYDWDDSTSLPDYYYEISGSRDTSHQRNDIRRQYTTIGHGLYFQMSNVFTEVARREQSASLSDIAISVNKPGDHCSPLTSVPPCEQPRFGDHNESVIKRSPVFKTFDPSPTGQTQPTIPNIAVVANGHVGQKTNRDLNTTGNLNFKNPADNSYMYRGMMNVSPQGNRTNGHGRWSTFKEPRHSIRSHEATRDAATPVANHMTSQNTVQSELTGVSASSKTGLDWIDEPYPPIYYYLKPDESMTWC